MLPLTTKAVAHRLVTWSVLPLLATLTVGCNGNRPEETDSEQPSTHASINKVNAQGRILPAHGFSRLAAVGIVQQVHVEAGQEVKQGDLLVTLQSSRALNLQLKVARERLEEAKQQKHLAEVQAQQLVDAAELKLRQIAERKKLVEEDQAELLSIAQDQVGASRHVLSRLKTIASDKLTGEFVGDLEIDRQEVAIREAELQYEQQRVSHKQSQDELKFAEDIAKTELAAAKQSLKAAKSSRAVEIAESEIAVLKTQSGTARIRAPSKGLIIGINVRAGESSVQLPIIEMADVEQLVCEAEINELDAARVQEGDEATMTSRAFHGDELHGTVARISNVVGRPQLKPFDPLAPVDYRSLTAVIELDEESRKLAKEWLQLQVDVEITVDSGSSAESPASKTSDTDAKIED